MFLKEILLRLKKKLLNRGSTYTSSSPVEQRSKDDENNPHKCYRCGGSGLVYGYSSSPSMGGGMHKRYDQGDSQFTSRTCPICRGTGYS